MNIRSFVIRTCVVCASKSGNFRENREGWQPCRTALLTYKILHGSAPQYLSPLVPVANLPGRRTLRSASTNQPSHATTCQTDHGRQTNLPGLRASSVEPTIQDNVSAPSLAVFRCHLKDFLFKKSYPDTVIWLLRWHFQWFL